MLYYIQTIIFTLYVTVFFFFENHHISISDKYVFRPEHSLQCYLFNNKLVFLFASNYEINYINFLEYISSPKRIIMYQPQL